MLTDRAGFAFSEPIIEATGVEAVVTALELASLITNGEGDAAYGTFVDKKWIIFQLGLILFAELNDA